MGKVEAYIDGVVGLRRGDIIRIRRGIIDGSFLHVTEIENVTAGMTQQSQIDLWVFALPEEFVPPITGRVEGVDVIDDRTGFSLATGVSTEDNRFFSAGSFEEGQNVLRRLLEGETGGYIKILDPYTTKDTLDLLTSVRKGTRVEVLCDANFPRDNPAAATALRAALVTKARGLTEGGREVEVRFDASGKLHARYILTGIGGWLVDASLKDLGKRDANLSRLTDSSALEGRFNEQCTVARR